ncbi:MAG: protein kinase [Gemmatimonadales bacterium]
MSEITERLTTAIADRYKILSHLGQGGMATVYLAEDVKHDRKVALKVLRPELAAVVGAERFLQEIKVTANLQHPHILPLHDSGEADSFLYYVMPYIEGETLRDKIDKEKQLGIDHAVDVARSVASALDYAHRQGVIHRDIKPENVLLHDEQALVADFGIALAISEAGGNRLTETGLSIGTPHYMSPEQAMGDREVDARSDVYSLGAMMYEMLTGDPPYQGSTAQAIVAKVITEKAPPVTATRDTAPPHVAAAVQKALAKLPADRFATAADFADALTRPGAIPLTVAAEAAAETPSKRSVPAIGVIAAIAFIGAAIGAFIGRRTAPEPAPRLTQYLVPTPDSVGSFGRCCAPAMALSPDGNTLVFVMGGDRGSLFRREAGRLNAEPIPGTEGAAGPFFSPDGRWVGFRVDTRLRKVSMAGGPPVTIADIGGRTRGGGSWGDNDLIIYSSDVDRDLYVVPGAGGEPRRLATSEEDQYTNPDMLPGGEAAVFSVRPGGSLENVFIAVVDLASGRIDTTGVAGTAAAFARPGHLVYTGADGSLLAQPFDPGARRTTGQAVAILDGVLVRGDGNGEYGVSAEGSLVYYPGAGGGGEEDLVLISGGTQEAVRLPQGGNFEDVAISPDGRRIAIRLADVNDGADLWVFDRNQGTLLRLTVEGENTAPRWTPDGTRIAFRSTRGGTDGIFWKPADASGNAELLYDGEGNAYPMSWLPDGSALLFIENSGEVSFLDIGLLTLRDTTVRWLVESPFSDRQPQVSPNGRWFAYTSDRSGDSEVYIQSLSGEGGLFQVSTEGGSSPLWSPDGRTLYYGTGPQITAAAVTLEPEISVASRSVVAEGFFDFNFLMTNYDIDPVTEELLMILQGGEQQQTSLVWIQNWQEIIRGMETGR